MDDETDIQGSALTQEQDNIRSIVTCTAMHMIVIDF